MAERDQLFHWPAIVRKPDIGLFVVLYLVLVILLFEVIIINMATQHIVLKSSRSKLHYLPHGSYILLYEPPILSLMSGVVFTMSKYDHIATNVTSAKAQRDLSLFAPSVPLSVNQL